MLALGVAADATIAQMQLLCEPLTGKSIRFGDAPSGSIVHAAGGGGYYMRLEDRGWYIGHNRKVSVPFSGGFGSVPNPSSGWSWSGENADMLVKVLATGLSGRETKSQLQAIVDAAIGGKEAG